MQTANSKADVTPLPNGDRLYISHNTNSEGEHIALVMQPHEPTTAIFLGYFNQAEATRLRETILRRIQNAS